MNDDEFFLKRLFCSEFTMKTYLVYVATFPQALLRNQTSGPLFAADPQDDEVAESPASGEVSDAPSSPLKTSSSAMEGFQIFPKDKIKNPHAIFAIGASIYQWRQRPNWNVGLPPLDLKIKHRKDMHQVPFRRRFMRLSNKIRRQSRGRRRDDLAWNATMKYVSVVDGDFENQEVRFSWIFLVFFFVVPF